MLDSCFSTSAVSCWVAGVVNVCDVLAMALVCFDVVPVVVTGALTALHLQIGRGVFEGFVLNFSAAIRVADGLCFKSTERFFFGGLGGSSEVRSN